MKNECNIVKDLIPLYMENMASADSASLVEEHIKDCEDCRRELERLKTPAAESGVPDATPLKNLRKKLAAKRAGVALMAVFFTLAVMLSLFASLSAPEYFPYSENLVSVESTEGEVLITFDEEVMSFDVRQLADPDNEGTKFYEITAWTSAWEKWFSGECGTLSTRIATDENAETVIVYSANDGKGSVPIYGRTGYDMFFTLPRLTLGYYFLIAVAAFSVCLVVWLILLKKETARKWVERVGLIPASYIVASLIVLGVGTSTYSIMRDFFLILAISVSLYAFFLILQNFLYLKREINSFNR